MTRKEVAWHRFAWKYTELTIYTICVWRMAGNYDGGFAPTASQEFQEISNSDWAYGNVSLLARMFFSRLISLQDLQSQNLLLAQQRWYSYQQPLIVLSEAHVSSAWLCREWWAGGLQALSRSPASRAELLNRNIFPWSKCCVNSKAERTGGQATIRTDL